jgi:predicted nuclease of restriction endonuclease-like (RecB) superfamily
MNKDSRKQRGKIKEQVVFPLAEALSEMPEGYSDFITAVKNRISTQVIQTRLNANVDMIMMYWHIGHAILEKQKKEGWGTKVIDRMSYDLKAAFPQMSGFSPRNLKYMRKFAEAWPEESIVQRTVAQIPWRSNITLLDKLNDSKLRLWYAQKVLENGMGKDMLAHQIESGLHLRVGAALNNFELTLPSVNSDLVQQSFKDPYIFDFLGADIPIRERELEQKLINHIQRFLLELGQGFAFVGKQVHLELGNQDYYIDLLFYHLKLRCFVVIELKAGEFKPEYVSKLNVYQNVVNDVLKHEYDEPTIGLLLVKEKNRLVVEYSLMNNSNPIGVANWENAITKHLPESFKSSLPTIEELESELKADLTDD